MTRYKLVLILFLASVMTACSTKHGKSLNPKTPSPIATTASAAPVSSASQATVSAEETFKGTNSTGLPLNVPTGFTLSTYTKKLENPRVIIFDKNNTAIVSIPAQNKVVAIKDGGDAQKVLVDKVNAPHGLALVCDTSCKLFVGETDGISRYDYDAEKVSTSNGTRIMNLPTGGRHSTKTLQILDGEKKLLISIGSSCDVCQEKDNRRGTIMIADLDGQNAKVFANGLRNSVFMAAHPQTKQIWATEMGRDYLGDELPPDEINIIQENKNYGWPVCYGKNVHDTDFDKKLDINNPCKEPTYAPSHIDLPAHSAPLGLTFTPDSWPQNMKNSLLVSYHGSWNRTQPTGYKVVRITLDDAGNYTGKHDFITGWLGADGKSIGRPVGLQVDIKGNLLITDDKLGNIYKLAYTP